MIYKVAFAFFLILIPSYVLLHFKASLADCLEIYLKYFDIYFKSRKIKKTH